jgi:hypothetical protein
MYTHDRKTYLRLNDDIEGCCSGLNSYSRRSQGPGKMEE